MCTHNLHKTSPNLGINDNNFGILFQINDCVPWTMNESSRGEAGGGDPPISGGFPPPPHPKEEFPTPPSSAQGQRKSVTNISKSSEAPSSSKTKNKIDDRIEECLNQNVGELSR